MRALREGEFESGVDEKTGDVGEPKATRCGQLTESSGKKTTMLSRYASESSLCWTYRENVRKMSVEMKKDTKDCIEGVLVPRGCG